ncbi:MAG: tetratricopeptide repeat protein [Prolixibacteraceae bacterium]|jgi:tetratricopeptide (TPR) repeat protein|nr:tetratricopeptide repeat protein [Prolixibacteraceae bacterium]
MTSKKVKKEPLLDRLELFCKNKANIILYISLFVSLLISLLLFNRDVSVGGDDSGYIKSAYDFAKGLSFPGFHSSFYSMTLALFISIFGVNLVILKGASLLFNLVAILFLNKFFRKFSSYTVAAFVTLATSLSYMLADYASTTYSEAYFFMLQAMYIYYFLSVVHNNEYRAKWAQKHEWLHYVGLGVFTYLIFQTKAIALAAFVVSIFYILFNKKYIKAAIYTAATVISHVLFTLYKTIAFDSQGAGFEAQLQKLLQKNPYNPAEGNETFWGFFQRFWENSELYFSKHFMKMMGIFPTDHIKTSTFLTIILYAVFIVSAIYIIRKNRKNLFVVLYLAAMISGTYVMLQTRWDQERLIMIYFPLIFGVIFLAAFRFFNTPQKIKNQWIPATAMGLIVLLMAGQSVGSVSRKIENTGLKTEQFESYYPDWQNYMAACQWAGQNLREDSKVLCRKPSMAWIAGEGKDIFKGLYRLKYRNPDSTLMMFQEWDITHVIMARLRVIPHKKTPRTINTIQNALTYLLIKNPGCLTQIAEFGDDEKARVYEVNLDIKRGTEEYIDNLDAAITINPRVPSFYYEKCFFLSRLQEYKTLIRYCDFALHFIPKDERIYFERGTAYYALNDYQKAINDYEKAIELKPSYAEAWFNAAVAYFDTGNIVKAKTYLEKSKSLGMKNYNRFEQQLINAR